MPKATSRGLTAKPSAADEEGSALGTVLGVHSQKGAAYARIFRKAGIFLGKHEIDRAVETLTEGLKLAEKNGDRKMAALFAEEIARARATPKSY